MPPLPPLFRLARALALAAWAWGGGAAALADSISDEYAIRSWHISDGLASEEAHRVELDQRGFLLIGGPNGVDRFDGSRFQRLLRKSQLGAEVFGPQILRTTGRWGLLAGLRDGGLFALEGQQLVPSPWSAALGRRTIVDLWESADGSLWLATGDNRLLRADEAGLEDITPWAGSGLPGKSSFAQDGNGVVWATNGDEIARFVNGRLHLHPLPMLAKEIRIASSRGPLWLVADDRILRMPGNAGLAAARIHSLIGAHFIQSLLEDRLGRLWIGTRSQGLWRLGDDGAAVKLPGAGDDIYRILEDHDGNLWIGSNGYGLTRLRRKNHEHFDRADGLASNFSRTVCQDRDGAVWLANGDGGLVTISADGIRKSIDEPGLEPFSPYVVAPHPGGGVWATTSNRVYHARSGPRFALAKVAEFAGQPIINIALARRSDELAIALAPGRIALLSPEGGAPRTIADGLPPVAIRCLAEDGAGNLWAGLESGEIMRLRNGSSRFERVAIPGLERSGPIQSIAFRADDSVWIATALRGVAIAREGQPTLMLSSDNGLPSDDITEILFDDAGHVWLASISGIFKIALSEIDALPAGKAGRLHPILLGGDDGLQNLSCIGYFQPRAWKASDGRLWFNTRFGTLAFDPAPPLPGPTAPQAFIDRLALDEETPIPLASSIRLRAGMRSVSFAFSALCLSTPDNVAVYTRLEGFEDAWTLHDGNRKVTYPSLPPGDYRFRVRAGNGQGIDSEQALAVAVLPLWHQRPEVRAAMALAVAALLVHLARAWSHRRLQIRLTSLEREHAVERERARISRDIHDDLGSSLTRIGMLSEIALRSDAAKSQNALGRINATVKELARSMDEIVWAVNPKFDDIESLVYYVSNFAQRFLGLADIRCRLDAPESLPSIPLSSQSRHNLFVCCKEALNNVVKHAGATEVLIAIAATDGRLEIAVQDNGRGLGDATHTDSETSINGHGNGLGNMRKRMSEIGGSVALRRSETPSGLAVVFSISLQTAIPKTAIAP